MLAVWLFPVAQKKAPPSILYASVSSCKLFGIGHGCNIIAQHCTSLHYFSKYLMNPRLDWKSKKNTWESLKQGPTQFGMDTPRCCNHFISIKVSCRADTIYESRKKRCVFCVDGRILKLVLSCLKNKAPMHNHTVFQVS